MTEQTKNNSNFDNELNFDEAPVIADNSKNALKTDSKKANKKASNINPKKVKLTWALTILSFIFFIAAAVVLSLTNGKVSSIVFLVEMIVLSGLHVIFGLTAHFIAKKHINNGCKVQYYLTFFAYLAIFPIVIPVGLVGFMLYVLIKGIKDGDLPSSKPKEVTVYTLRDKYGNTRELIECGRDKDYNIMKDYTRYRDDIGYYWRSYDNGKTFIEE